MPSKKKTKKTSPSNSLKRDLVCKTDYQKEIKEIISVLQKAALGDFSVRFKDYEEENELVEVKVALNLMIGTSTGTCSATSTTGSVDLSALVTEGYLGSVPTDPSSGSSSETDYYLVKDSTGIITIGACEAENSVSISVSR